MSGFTTDLIGQPHWLWGRRQIFRGKLRNQTTQTLRTNTKSFMPTIQILESTTSTEPNAKNFREIATISGLTTNLYCQPQCRNPSFLPNNITFYASYQHFVVNHIVFLPTTNFSGQTKKCFYKVSTTKLFNQPQKMSSHFRVNYKVLTKP